MIGLIRSEWIKVSATKMWWILLIIGMLLVALGSLPILLLSNLAEGENIPELSLTDPNLLRQLWAAMGSAQVIALIIGILSFTGEYRHETITDTFLTEPRRGRVIAAKAVVNAVIGVILAVLTCATVIALALWLLPDPHAPVEWDYVTRIALGVALNYALYAVLGVAVGALITNQIAAVVLALLWVLVLESLVVALRPDLGQWLPGGATQAIVGGDAGLGITLLAPWVAVLVLLGYAAVLSTIAATTTLRRDIT